ncbi:hypothetical protein GCM10009639_52680 [Kitasatospora putterlickiae]|uniref:Uncharacterized protein n=1 Tax=Kitasatospora putterlickiae TaxID=221725 RepID=A0ABN1YDD0_9ACTN
MKEDRLVTVEITGGIMPPTTYVLLPKALTALWSALRFRPVSRPQWEWFERCLTGPCSERLVREHLDGTGPLSLPVILPDSVHHLRVRWAGSD